MIWQEAYLINKSSKIRGLIVPQLLIERVMQNSLSIGVAAVPLDA
jgi:hypothetical protein